MKNLILLEEDLEGREALARILRMRGFRVIQAESEAAAHAVLASNRPVDLILAGATYRDRVEFLADVRKARRALPIIFLTDYCGPESRMRGLRYGAFAIFRPYGFFMNMRPVALHELDRLIRIVLNGTAVEHREETAAA